MKIGDVIPAERIADVRDGNEAILSVLIGDDGVWLAEFNDDGSALLVGEC